MIRSEIRVTFELFPQDRLELGMLDQVLQMLHVASEVVLKPWMR